jgi:methionyl-tRNA formyltransferase
LPYGRGGSPIQNLIIRGFTKAPLCVLKMTDVLDGGGIYASVEIELIGNVAEIFSRMASIVEELIVLICKTEPSPKEQIGEAVYFKRLTIDDNELLPIYSQKEMYDRIRMVDGLDYPRAYIKFGNLKLEFTEANFKEDENSLTAKVKVVDNVS